jgi:hypothetical protein
MTTPNQHGGYRKPTRPAPVSGPGKLSKRTDGGPSNPGPKQPVRDVPGMPYGEGQELRTVQAGAPMSAAPGPGGAPAPGPAVQPADLSGVTALDAPTSRPGEPVTAGANAGPGPGMDALGMGGGNDPGVQYLRTIMPSLEVMANMPMASDAFRQFVRRTRAAM